MGFKDITPKLAKNNGFRRYVGAILLDILNQWCRSKTFGVNLFVNSVSIFILSLIIKLLLCFP